MGTICILLGLIIFIASLFGGILAARAYPASPLALTLPGLLPGVNMTVLIIAVVGGIGLLICLTLVLQGLTLNRVNKLIRMHKRHGS